MEARLACRRYYVTLNMFAADFYKMVKNCQVGGCTRTQGRRGGSSPSSGGGGWTALACGLGCVPALRPCGCPCCCHSRPDRSLGPPCSPLPPAVQRQPEPVLFVRAPPVRPVLGHHAVQRAAQPGGRRHRGAQALRHGRRTPSRAQRRGASLRALEQCRLAAWSPSPGSACRRVAWQAQHDASHHTNPSHLDSIGPTVRASH